MQGKEVMQQTVTPMLFPVDPEMFWQHMHLLVREKVRALVKNEISTNQFQALGVGY